MSTIVPFSNISYFGSLRSHLGYNKANKTNCSMIDSSNMDLISFNDIPQRKPQSRSRMDPRKLVIGKEPGSQNQIQSNRAFSDLPLPNITSEVEVKKVEVITNISSKALIHSTSSYNKVNLTKKLESTRNSTKSSKDSLKFTQAKNSNFLIKRGKFKGIYDDRQSKCIYSYLKPNMQSHHRCICKISPIVQSPLKITCAAIPSLKKENPNSPIIADDVLSGRFRNGYLLNKVKKRLSESKRISSDYEHLIFEKIPRSIKRSSSLDNMRSFCSNSGSMIKVINEESLKDENENSFEDNETIITELTDHFTVLSTTLSDGLRSPGFTSTI